MSFLISVFVIGWQGRKREGKNEEGGIRERKITTRSGNWGEKGGRKKKQMLILEAAPAEFRLLYRWACWVHVTIIKPKLEQVSLPRRAHPLTWFSNVKRHASENTTQPGWSVQGHCAAGCFILNSWGHQPDGQLLPCLPSDADISCKQSLDWE